MGTFYGYKFHNVLFQPFMFYLSIIFFFKYYNSYLWTNNHYKHKIPSDPTSYAAYRKGFTDSLDARELSFYNDMYNHPMGEYKTVYTNRETLKTIKKLCKKLPQDFKYTGATSVKEADGRVKKYIFFQRLKPIAFSPTINTVTNSMFVEAL